MLWEWEGSGELYTAFALRLVERVTGKLIGKFRKQQTIHLIGEEREGGYTYVTSPELPGFTLMLEPGEEASPQAFRAAVEEPLKMFIRAMIRAERATEPLELTSFRPTQHNNRTNYVVEVCHA